MFWFFGCEVYGILVTQPGIEPVPPALEGEALTTGPPGNSFQLLLTPMCCVLSCFSHVQLFATPWTVAHQDPLSIGFYRKKNTGLACRAFLQGIFPTQRSNPYLMSPALAGRFFTMSATCDALFNNTLWLF